MKKLILSLSILLTASTMFGQVTHQVCVTEAQATGGNSCTNTAVFTPANLTINVGDKIQFTTFMVALTGYNGTHDIQFTGSSANNVLLPISTNILSQVTTVTTPSFNNPGTFPMECVDANHCFIADLMSGWLCTGYSVTVTGITTEIQTEKIRTEINIYPNPSNNIINIDLLPLENDNPIIYLVDILGKTLNTIQPKNSLLSIDVSNYKKGSYFVKIVSDNYNFTMPIMIQ